MPCCAVLYCAVLCCAVLCLSMHANGSVCSPCILLAPLCCGAAPIRPADVSRYAGCYEHVFESTTAGVTIQAPQLDINTVAAGGGSRLFFRSGVFQVRIGCFSSKLSGMQAWIQGTSLLPQPPRLGPGRAPHRPTRSVVTVPPVPHRWAPSRLGRTPALCAIAREATWPSQVGGLQQWLLTRHAAVDV